MHYATPNLPELKQMYAVLSGDQSLTQELDVHGETHGVQLMHELGMKVLNPQCNTLESFSHLNENANKMHSAVVRAGIK